MNQIIVTIISTIKGNNNVYPHADVYKYDITDDGYDIIKYIERRETTGDVLSGGIMELDNEYSWNKPLHGFKVGDHVKVVAGDHPLQNQCGYIASIKENVYLVCIGNYCFNIPPFLLEKND